MTVEKISDETQELRDFVDALRYWLGLPALYNQNVNELQTERLHGDEVPLPTVLHVILNEPKPDWFMPAESRVLGKGSFHENERVRAAKRRAAALRERKDG